MGRGAGRDQTDQDANLDSLHFNKIYVDIFFYKTYFPYIFFFTCHIFNLKKYYAGFKQTLIYKIKFTIYV